MQNTRLYLDADDPGRTPVFGLDLLSDTQLSPRLKKAYQSALNVYAIGEAEATAVTCRRVLEGVIASVLKSDASGTLARQIKTLAESRAAELAQPLIDLSHALREGGNLGAHFDDELDVSLADAGHFLDLLDYMLIYLFVVPEQIRRFRDEVDGEEPS